MAYRVLAGVGVLVLVLGVLAVTGQRPLRRVIDTVDHLRGSGRVAGISAASEEQQGDATAAVDDVRALGWSPLWPAAGADVDPETVCRAEQALGPSITLTFPASIDVREIGIESGLPAGDVQRPARWRPRVVRLDWSDEGCQAIHLDDVPDLQRFAADAPEGSTAVKLTILSTYPANPAVPGPVDLGEVVVWSR